LPALHGRGAIADFLGVLAGGNSEEEEEEEENVGAGAPNVERCAF